MTALDIIHAEADRQAAEEAAFLDRLWAWLPQNTDDTAIVCAICGVQAPAFLARGEFCVSCADQ